MRAGPLDDELANLVRNAHYLDDGGATEVAGVFAAVAAAPAIERHTVEKARVNAQIFEHPGGISDGLLADRANPAHKALRAGEDHRRGDQEGSDAHVVEARDGAGSVIAVHS